MSFSSCHFPSNTKYSVLTLWARDGQPVRDQKPHSLRYRNEPHHTCRHTWASPHLFITQTSTFAQLHLL